MLFGVTQNVTCWSSNTFITQQCSYTKECRRQRWPTLLQFKVGFARVLRKIVTLKTSKKSFFCLSMHSTSVSIYHNILDIAVIIHFVTKNVARICIFMFTRYFWLNYIYLRIYLLPGNDAMYIPIQIKALYFLFVKIA